MNQLVKIASATILFLDASMLVGCGPANFKAQPIPSEYLVESSNTGTTDTTIDSPASNTVTAQSAAPTANGLDIKSESKDPADGFVAAPCGSLPIQSLLAPHSLAVGSIIRSRLDESRAPGSQQTIRIELDAGTYDIAGDTYRSDGRSSNVGMSVEMYDLSGRSLQRLISSNEIAFRTRAVGKFSLAAKQTVMLKVSNKFAVSDYELGIFRHGSPVPTPYFSHCPRQHNLAVNQSPSFRVDSSLMLEREQYFVMDVVPGDYQIRLAVQRADGKKSNVGAKLNILELTGDIESGKRLLHINEIDFSATDSATLNIATAKRIYLVVEGSFGTVQNVSLQLLRQ
jgi:hypothetical protein